MHPTAARSSRSSQQTSIPSASTTSALVHQHPPQQHQQQILYGPIANPIVPLQPCGTSIHPPCVYPGTQRNAGPPTPIPLHMQGRGSRWLSKNKVLRSQQQYGQQQQLPYNSKSLILFDQTSTNAPPPPSTTSFLLASSTFAHGSFAGDQYGSSGVTLVPQTYFKPSDVQAFCLVQDRQANQQQQDPTSGDSYYNISAANACSLQSINANSTFQFANLSPYAAVTTFTNNQIVGPPPTVQPAQVYPGLVFGAPQRDRPHSSTPDVSTFKCARSKFPIPNATQFAPLVRTENYSEWTSNANASFSGNLFGARTTNEDTAVESGEVSLQRTTSNVSAKTQEEHRSDESSTSFDFTIEAEKMVSALCNTTSSNDLGKEEARNSKGETMPLFSGAGDTASNKGMWFADFCTSYGSARSVAVQTEGPCVGASQYPELIRKAAYWGCTEAEVVLTDSSRADSKYSVLRNISCATRTAITKSSTCFPIFGGDRVFIGDLINALLRISNGWLILDNYLNKQHYPSLAEKYDRELVRCFQTWEESTYVLLNKIVQTFLKLNEQNGNSTDEQRQNESSRLSFPGDVSLYTTHDVLGQSSNTNVLQQQNPTNKDSLDQFSSGQLLAANLRNIRYYDTGQQSQQQKEASQKEAKSRSKWTVTENILTRADSTKSVPDMFVGHSETNAQVSNRFRAKCSSSSATKANSSAQSLNDEFFHLKSKVLESSHESAGQRATKDKKQEFLESKISTSPENVGGTFRPQRSTPGASCENAYTQNRTPLQSAYSDPASVSSESVFYIPKTNALSCLEYNYATYSPYPVVDYDTNGFSNFEQNYGSKPASIDPVYVGKSTAGQLELAAVPKTKMTLLSQIEPSIPEKASEEMTANLSAWFASMRSSNGHCQIPVANLAESRTVENIIPRLPLHQDTSTNTMELMKKLQIDANRQLQTLQNMQNIQSAPWNACNLLNNRVQVRQVSEEYDSSEDVRVYMKPGSYNVPKKRHQRKSNRRAESSSLQRNSSGNNTAGQLNHCPSKEKTFYIPAPSTSVLRATTSSIAATVSNSATTTMKLPLSTDPVVQTSIVSLENSPRILRRTDTTAQEIPRDVTWKAACASAEILLEALNVKVDVSAADYEEADSRNRNGENRNDRDGTDDMTLEKVTNQEDVAEDYSKTLKHNYDCGGASSYEASEDDSGSTCQLSANTSLVEVGKSPECKNGCNKTNVKTDSWLIRTLNNASVVSKQKRRKKSTEQNSSESSNSSALEDSHSIRVASLTTVDAETTTTNATSTTIKKFQQTACSEEGMRAPPSNDDHPTLKESERVLGKATYSETVRRYAPLNTLHSGKKEPCKRSKLNVPNSATVCSTVVPIPGRKCQRKDPERSYFLLHKSRKSSGKKASKNCDVRDCQAEEGPYGKSRILRKEMAREELVATSLAAKSAVATKSHGKKKDSLSAAGEFLDGKSGKSGDRGWSVWYSSKRKQSLSPLALSKLETIHQMVWQMEEAQIFKCPSIFINPNDESLSSQSIEDYCKVVKSPMFLETIGYKLKNRIYHKVEHVIRDFRRIVYNSKLYHKDHHDRVRMIESLSKKLEGLFEEHFASWDFGNISGSPREGSPTSHRFKVMTQKPVGGRYGNTKKSSSSSIVTNENVSLH